MLIDELLRALGEVMKEHDRTVLAQFTSGVDQRSRSGESKVMYRLKGASSCRPMEHLLGCCRGLQRGAPQIREGARMTIHS